MRAEFDQNDLDPGYARVTLTREDSDTGFYEDGDGIAIGKYTGNTCEYLCAAGGSPSTVPKFPCPSTSGTLMEKSCASLTSAS